ncbi:uncharacterized protein LOC119732115 isoform X2 [Patiria miniata]|uniref:EGF-like domain-containing protein n=1 Tax=Patiria miniata TaxID=46514 RepID=A0A914AC57_PATMI|nr:uncharacterized protein LOC119732115 isoform X2 [Patiria miniata]
MGHDRNCFKTSFVSFISCLWLIVSFDAHSVFAQATAPMPKQLPSVFTTGQTLNRLRNILCKSCSHQGRNRQCREYGQQDVCYLLCGCGNYGKCLAEGSCTCPLIPEEGCPLSQTLCLFDDASICSTENDICLYYDERKIRCECRDGWIGENCQTCSDESTSCKLDEESLDPPVSGSELTIKVLVIACAGCLILGIIIGVFCMCRTGKLVCITTSRVENRVENFRKDETQERNLNRPVTRQHSDHAYCHVIQYAVPETPTSQPISETSQDAGYAELNITRHRKSEGIYYFKLESPSSGATYESVKKSSSAVTPFHNVKDDASSIDVMNKELDKKSGNREFKGNPWSSDEYDHLQRQVDVNISETSKNYSHLALQEFL